MRNDLQTSNPAPAPAPAQARQNGGGGAPQDGTRYAEAALTPPVDVIEDAGGITLYADLPGVNHDKLNLHIESETLTIEAESDLAVPQGLTSSHTEVGLGRFRRVFTLSKELDPERILAELAHGC